MHDTHHIILPQSIYSFHYTYRCFSIYSSTYRYFSNNKHIKTLNRLTWRCFTPFTSFCNCHTQTLSQKPRQRTSTQFTPPLTAYSVKILPARVLPSLALNHTRSIEHRTTTNSTHPIHAMTTTPSLPKIAVFRTERVVEPIARRALHYQSCFIADLTRRSLVANQRFGNRLHDLDTAIAQLVQLA